MTKFLVGLIVLISCSICSGADASEIPLQTNTQTLDNLLDSIRTNVAPIGTTTADLKKHLCKCSNISPEQYIASFLHLLDHHYAELNEEELSDVHFYIAEELYKTIGYQLVWQYINLYPTTDHELLEAHQLFLAGLIFANNKENATKAIEKYFDVESEANTISITWEKISQEYLQFQVIDTGIGIPEKVKPTIFKLFSKYSKQAGNGIGLSTCSRIVSFLGGQIHVESAEGKGTTMIFTVKINGVSDHVYHVHGG